MLEEQGYLVLAANTEHTDYVSLARRLAQSIHQWHPAACVALLTNTVGNYPEFSHVIDMDIIDPVNPWANDSQIFYKTPFRETIKLEADMIMASPCDHWWSMFRHKDVVVSTGCRNWQDQVSNDRTYRKIFDQNSLPDVYNAITYWRRSTTAREFFDLVRDIFADWATYSRTLRYPEQQPSTDVVYAMAAQIMGPERVTLPFATYPKIVHMKSAHAGTQRQNWTEELVWETDPLRIQTIAQWGAFHYNIKDWQP